MTGHIRKRGERSWELKYDVGADARGKRKTRYVSFKGTKRDAQIELAKLIAAASIGNNVDPTRVTVNEFIDRWEKEWVETNVSPKTAEGYIQKLRLYVRPELGNLRLQKVRPAHLTQLYADLAKRVSARTIVNAHVIFHLVLEHAVDWDILSSNPADRVSPPRVEQEEVSILAPSQINALLMKADGHVIYDIASLALATGLRRGELLALRWQDIDLDAATLRVVRSLEQTKTKGLRFKQPKTKNGKRTITLPKSAVANLRAYLKAEQEVRLKLGAGRIPASALVFGNIDGSPRRPDGVSSMWRKVAIKAGIICNLHSLRHTHASHLISKGVDILTISRRLGHASPAFTLTVYGHLMPQSDAEAAAAIDGVLTVKTRTK